MIGLHADGCAQHQQKAFSEKSGTDEQNDSGSEFEDNEFGAEESPGVASGAAAAFGETVTSAAERKGEEWE